MNNQEKLRDYLRRVMAELQVARSRLRDVERRAAEPIAIVGMSCRYPGGVRTPEQLWALVDGGGDAITDFPDDRGWDMASLRPDTVYVRKGGFLADAAEFDAGFFGISPREALRTDPQQRLLLETSWEALERAGIDPESLRGSRTAVFTGAMYHDYPGSYGAGSVLSGRIAYTLGLEGSAVTVDTACSSSLVALHQAIAALRRGECGLALVGGVTVMATPGAFVEFAAQRGLAPDGRCKSFAAAADGTAWSEGVGVLVVERLSDALEAGHRVLAVVRGSAVNSDGASNGLTAPNGPAQQRVIRDALLDAGLSPAQVDAVEAHGTGTPLGDPVEAQALLATYGRDRPAPLWLGSIKSNLGHSQAASGVAGIIKMVMALHHERLPRTLHVDEPTPHVDWAGGGVRLLTEPADWPRGEQPRRAAVSSFGVSGTNAHVVLEEPPAADRTASDPGTGPWPWAVSGRSGQGLRAQAAALHAFLTERPDLDPADVGWSLATTRAAGQYRATVVGADRAAMLRGLADLAAATPSPDVVEGTTGPAGAVAFLFPGQGSQWPEMARTLLATEPVFRARIEECAAAMAPFADWSLTAVLRGEPGAPGLDRVDVVQPALFAVMVALAELWRSLGVQPAAVAGHSQGEIAAACVAGGLSLSDAARVVTLRSQALLAMAGQGGMVSLALPPADVRDRLPAWGGKLSVAAVNGPSSVVVSGEDAALDDLLARCDAEGIRARRVDVDYASHSAQMDAIRGRLLDVLGPIRPRTGDIPFFSAVDARWCDTATLDAEYWFRNLRETVRFDEAVTALLERGCTNLVEVSPHPVISLGAQDTVEAAGVDAAVVGTLRRDEGDRRAMLVELARLHARGVRPDWEAVFPGARPVELPTTVFQHDRYWITTAAADAAALGMEPVDHPLLGAQLPDGDSLVLTGRLSAATQPWLADHVVEGRTVLPGAAFVELALRAGDEVGCDLIEELTLQAPLVLGETTRIRLDLAEPTPDGRRAVTFSARTGDGPWTRHAGAVLAVGAPQDDREDPAWPPPGAEPIDPAEMYDRLNAVGLAHGPALRGVRALWRRRDEVFAEVSLDGIDPGGFGLHPALLDACLHPVALGGFTSGGHERPWLPFAWSGVRLHAVGATALRVRLSPAGTDAVRLVLEDHTGSRVATVETLVLRPVATDLPVGSGDLYRLEWTALRAPEAGPAEPWTVLPGGADLAAELTAAGMPACRGTEAGSGPIAVAAETGDPLPAAGWALRTVRDWLAGPGGRLVVVTRDAARDIAGAAVRGLVRSAQLEHPDRFVLLDLPLEPTADDVTAASRALATDEPEIAIADGVAKVPRLARAEPLPAGEGLDPDGTVLITGGTGVLGGIVARHLVRAHGLRSVVLAGRRGADAPGAAELTAELSGLGAQTEVVACDVTDRAQLARLVAGRSIATVVHAAGVLDDTLVTSLTAERLEAVLLPKLAALTLHELLPEVRLVLFSSAAGVLGAVGQANYAAANAVLDALAETRHAAGLPGMSLAWGLWAQESTMTADRVERAGLPPLSTEDALAALDAALGRTDPVLIPIRLDTAALRTTGVPPVLRGLVRVPTRRMVDADAGVASELVTRLAGRTAAEQDRVLLDLVLAHTAAVLGYDSADRVAPERAFRDAGFGSVSAVELRNRLVAATGQRLPVTVVFAHPTPIALARELRDRLTGAAPVAPARATATDSGDPVVLVGIGCRFPGGVRTPEELWDLLIAERDGIVPFPGDRGWPLDRLHDPDPEAAGTSYVRHGGFLTDAADFDAAFFGISPREAVAMDPQQRLLLETCWEACEDAAIDPESLRGSRTGVFVGVMYQDYGQRLDASDAAGFLAPGVGGGVLSGRIAYTFGLEGPAVTVDTACSSSLVALHLAAQAVRAGECDLALAGGVTVLATPAVFVEFSRQRGLAPDGRCKSFSADADGTGMSEGVGVVLVERLSRARELGHQVLAVLRGSAVNSDGASNGMTAPNGSAQERVIRAALAAGGLVAADVDAVEAHGTGTTLGDPIEAQALLATYGQGRDEPLRLGTVKSNLGHTQAAAGVAGVIKAVLAIRHGVLPRSLYISAPTPHVDWTAGQVEPLTSAVPWPERGEPRRMGVSSFGISGTNAHVIIEQGPVAEPTSTGSAPASPGGGEGLPWLLSARSPAALSAQARSLCDVNAEPADVAYSLATGRAALKYRAMVSGADADELRAGLLAVAEDRPSAGVVRATAGRHRIALLFTGQGSQRAGMGRELYSAFPVFRDAFDEACAYLDPYLDQPLRDVVFDPSAERLDRTDFTQPALFAVAVAEARLLSSAGVVPDLVAGHSVGELAAAQVSGMLSLADAATLVAGRGRAMRALTGGAMLSVRAAEDEVRALIDDRPDIALAAVNGPRSVVLSGAETPVTALAAELTERGLRVRRLRGGIAFHSPCVEPALAELREIAAGVEFRTPEIPIVAASATGEEMTTPAYWVEQARGTVRFADAVRELHAAGASVFLEAGPDAVLAPAAAESLPGTPAVALLRRDRSEVRAVIEALGTLHTHGVGVDWPEVFAGRPVRRVSLPRYAFDHRRYWPEPAPPAVPSDPLWAAIDGADIATALRMLDMRGDESPAQVLAALAEARAETTPAARSRLEWAAVQAGPAELTGPYLLVASPRGETDDRVDAVAGALARHGAQVRVAVFDGTPGTPGTLGDVPDGVTVVSLLAPDTAWLSALAETLPGRPLWTLTESAVTVSPDDPDVAPDRSAVWALGARLGGVVDLPATLDVPTRSLLCALLAGERRGAAVRDGQVLTREPVACPEVTPWSPKGTVLVLGGTDRLTERLAESVVRAGARCVRTPESTDPQVTALLAHTDDVEAVRKALATVGPEPVVALLARPGAASECYDEIACRRTADRQPTVSLTIDGEISDRSVVGALYRAITAADPVVRLAARATPEPSVRDGEVRDEAERVRAASLREQLLDMPPERRLSSVLDGVRSLAAAVLGHEEGDELDADAEFFDLGLSSVTALELRNHLIELAGVDLPADLLYECPTPLALAERLLAEVTGPLADLESEVAGLSGA